MKLHSHPYSQHARRVLMLAAEIGIDLDVKPVSLETGAHRSEAFLKLNPFGQVPVLQDGDLILAESHAIMRYLVSTRGETDVYPTDRQARAHIDAWLDWNHTRLNPPAQTFFIHTRLMGERGDKALASGSRKQAETALGVFDTGLGRAQGIGAAITLADLSIASTVALYDAAGGDLSRFPAACAWFNGISARPSFRATAPAMG